VARVGQSLSRAAAGHGATGMGSQLAVARFTTQYCPGGQSTVAQGLGAHYP
jgi:hypothetical protein